MANNTFGSVSNARSTTEATTFVDVVNHTVDLVLEGLIPTNATTTESTLTPLVTTDDTVDFVDKLSAIQAATFTNMLEMFEKSGHTRKTAYKETIS